jgi:hypothetical protein
VTEPQDAVVQALQRVLAAQHAAVYGYPVIGVALRSAGQIRLARQLEAQHRHTRDELMAQLAARQVTPVPAQASYRAAQPVTGPADAQRWALDLEEDCAGAYRYLLVAPMLTGPPRDGTSASPGASGPRSSGASASGGTVPSAASQAALRRQALAGLTTAASDATRWRSLLNPDAPTTAFPGI